MKPGILYRRAIPRRVVDISVNVCGAALTTFYFISLPGGEPGSATGSAADWGIFVVVMLGLFALASRIARLRLSPLWAWYRQAASRASPEPAPLHIRQLALNLPVIGASISLAMWTLAGLLFGLLSGLNLTRGQFDWSAFGQVLLGVVGIVGPATSALHYFAVERAWRPELPLFFAEEDLTQTPAFRLAVRWRLMILFGLGAIPLLLLAILSYQQAAQIAYAPQPAAGLPQLLRLELLLAGAGIFVAVMLTRTIGASLIEPLETLSQRMTAVQKGSLDERVVVTSNDEIGILSAHFNTMVEGLKRRDVELKTIYQISQDIISNLELDQTLQAVLEQVQKIVPYDGAEICLYDPAENLLRVRAWAKSDRALTDTRGQAYRLGEGYTGWVGQQRQSLLVADVEAHQAQRPVTRQVANGVMLNSYLGVPLMANQKMVGTLELVSTHPGAFDEHARQLVETIAPQAAIALSNAAQVIERERRLKEQIEQLRIEIDQAKQTRQVAEITGTEYFQKLRDMASEMRKTRPSRQEDASEG